MSNYLEKLNNVLFNIKDYLSLDAIKDFLKLEDIEEFFKLIGYSWTGSCTFYDSTNKKVEDVNNITELCDLLSKEVYDEEEGIYKDKYCLFFELCESNKKPDVLEFYISPYIFYHRSKSYTITLDGNTKFHDTDYSKKWISFLLSKYGKAYADAVRQQFKKGFANTNKKYEDDMKDLKSAYEIIIKYSELTI